MDSFSCQSRLKQTRLIQSVCIELTNQEMERRWLTGLGEGLKIVLARLVLPLKCKLPGLCTIVFVLDFGSCSGLCDPVFTFPRLHFDIRLFQASFSLPIKVKVWKNFLLYYEMSQVVLLDWKNLCGLWLSEAFWDAECASTFPSPSHSLHTRPKLTRSG